MPRGPEEEEVEEAEAVVEDEEEEASEADVVEAGTDLLPTLHEEVDMPGMLKFSLSVYKSCMAVKVHIAHLSKFYQT